LTANQDRTSETPASDFDPVAVQYSESIQIVPQEYVDFMVNLFQIGALTRVIDLGCGDGTLAIELSQYSHHVEGLDKSELLLNLAQTRDSQSSVLWRKSSVERFQFEPDVYDLILSFESFHLFPSPEHLIHAIYSGLRRDGCLAIGWCRHFWEAKLKNIIIELFSEHGIQWGKWDYQMCPSLSELIAESGLGFGNLQDRRTCVPTRTTISRISSYLTCIAKAQTLPQERREVLRTQLLNAAMHIFCQENIEGLSEYGVKYCYKRN
jgi:SAM-dependent methyltransferase